MDKESVKSNVDNNIVDLLMAYGLLHSAVDIFSEVVVCDTSLENKYINMVKIMQMLVDDIEPVMESLCENLKELLRTEEV